MSDATNTSPATRTLTQVGPCTVLSRAALRAIERGDRSMQALSLPLNGECLCKSSFADSLDVRGRARR